MSWKNRRIYVYIIYINPSLGISTFLSWIASKSRYHMLSSNLNTSQLKLLVKRNAMLWPTRNLWYCVTTHNLRAGKNDDRLFVTLLEKNGIHIDSLLGQWSNDFSTGFAHRNAAKQTLLQTFMAGYQCKPKKEQPHAKNTFYTPKNVPRQVHGPSYKQHVLCQHPSILGAAGEVIYIYIHMIKWV